MSKKKYYCLRGETLRKFLRTFSINVYGHKFEGNLKKCFRNFRKILGTIGIVKKNFFRFEGD